MKSNKKMKIAVGGSAANPPHQGHKLIVQSIVNTQRFDQVRWIVSGDRPDKPGLILSRQRWEMSQLLFGGNFPGHILYEPEEAIPTVTVLNNLQECYPQAEITWYCGADHFVPRERFEGNCDILGFWDEGTYLFEKQKFLIIPRQGIDMENLQLPQKYEILEVLIPEISSTKIRRQIQRGKDVSELVGQEVNQYINQHKLYQGG